LKGYIILEDGTVFQGTSFGAPGKRLGEVVFNTSMTGYQEILTDPSYASQVVTMTYPLIGNYGVNEEDIESSRVWVSGFVVREACRYPSNHTCTATLGDYLKKNDILGIEGVDTRKLTRHIRLAGSMKAVLYAGDKEPDVAKFAAEAKEWVGLVGVDTVKDVTCKKAYEFKGTKGRTGHGDDHLHVVAMDFGVKNNSLRILRSLGCKVTVVPASTSSSDVMARKPDGVYLSNGPGDPAGVEYAVATIRELVGKVPLFGICLGHQLLTLALGGKTYKLKFGHHGGNHPVRNLTTSEIEITSQNHCFCADIASLKHTGVDMTHLNLNDNTCEGMADRERKLLSVQYHPEAAPGPHDSGYLFKEFVRIMESASLT
jgi:carbamoyl-phosphate synthase small subunit